MLLVVVTNQHEFHGGQQIEIIRATCASFYYPVLLTALIITFFVRERALDRRAVALASAYRALGFSDRTLALCFGAAQTPAVVIARESYFWSLSRSTFLFWGIPIATVIVSFAWVLASESLGTEAPRGVYLVAAGLLAVTCGVQLFTRTSKRSTAAQLSETA